MEEVGRYQIDALSGEGAMARVYKAYDPKIDRTLAIKVLKPHLLADDDYRGRFLREATGAGILSHPNIVTVFDVGEEDNQPYIAMEWVDGPTFADLLKQGKAFTPKEVVDIGIQLARALDYAHRKGIVHRDVKPGNIMLVQDTLTVKVADFGICRILEQRGQAPGPADADGRRAGNAALHGAGAGARPARWMRAPISFRRAWFSISC